MATGGFSDAVAVDAPREVASTKHQVGIVRFFSTTILTTGLGFYGAQKNGFCTNKRFECSWYKYCGSQSNDSFKVLPGHFYVIPVSEL